MCDSRQGCHNRLRDRILTCVISICFNVIFLNQIRSYPFVLEGLDILYVVGYTSLWTASYSGVISKSKILSLLRLQIH